MQNFEVGKMRSGRVCHICMEWKETDKEIFKRESCLLSAPVLTLWDGSHVDRSRKEVSYCTFGFGTIILGNLRMLLLIRDSPCNNHYACRIF